MSLLKIQMLGEFSISYNDKTISEKNRRSKKMWTLLKYLITFRDREVSQSEMIGLLWPGGESDNPAGALKTQLHRLRAMLAELELPAGQEMIVSSMGTYAFNNHLECSIDVTDFERYFRLSLQQEISEKEQTQYMQLAFALYKGDFLHKSGTQKWIVPINVYYHSVYLRLTHRLMEVLYKHRQLAELGEVCRHAILIDNYDEKIHYMLIKALSETGERQCAKKHYHYVIDLFYNQQGVNPSPELVALYEEIVGTDRQYEASLDVVKLHLSEEQNAAHGAFFCELEFFKHVYQLELREAERSRAVIHICLITIKDEFQNIPDAKLLGRAAQQLFDSISRSLRASDTFARYSASQFIIMLPSTSDEISEMVLQRIVKRFKKDNPKTAVGLEWRFGAGV